MTIKTILTNCPFCLEKTICSCCGQCVNPSCEYKQDSPKYSEMSDWYFYQSMIETYSKARMPYTETFPEYRARRERERYEQQKREEDNKKWEEEMITKNPNFYK